MMTTRRVRVSPGQGGALRAGMMRVRVCCASEGLLTYRAFEGEVVNAKRADKRAA